MKRTEIRTLIKEYLADNNVEKMSQQTADELKRFLQAKHPNEKFGNSYKVECKFNDLFVKSDCVSGKIDRYDPFEPDFIIDSVSFSIDGDLRVMVWEKDKIALNLDMSNLSEDDKTDIMNIDNYHNIDVYRSFIRIPPQDRGKLATMIPNSMVLECSEMIFRRMLFINMRVFFITLSTREWEISAAVLESEGSFERKEL